MSTEINLTYMYITQKYRANKIKKKKLTYLKHVLRKATKQCRANKIKNFTYNT